MRGHDHLAVESPLAALRGVTALERAAAATGMTATYAVHSDVDAEELTWDATAVSLGIPEKDATSLMYRFLRRRARRLRDDGRPGFTATVSYRSGEAAATWELSVDQASGLVRHLKGFPTANGTAEEARLDSVDYTPAFTDRDFEAVVQPTAKVFDPDLPHLQKQSGAGHPQTPTVLLPQASH